MTKTSFLLPRVKWGTLKSKYRPEDNRVTPDEFTLGSYNFITNNDGTIEKRPTDVQYNPVAFTNAAKDQFEAIFANGTHHLLVLDGGSLKYSPGDTTFTSAHTGLTATASMEYAMYQSRVYMDNGVDSPGVYDITASYGGVSYSTPQYKDMGCQVPVSAVTFGADTGTGLTGSFHYIVTFLYYGQEESNGGPASVLHTVTNKTINLTAVPIGGYGVTARNIYRDANDGVYLLVGTINDNTTTTYADSLTTGTTPIPVSNDTPPVFSYITLNLSRLWVAAANSITVFWSSPGLPDIFDPNNSALCNPKDPIQAVYTYQGITVILNRHSIGQILGNTDDTFFYQEIPGSVGCVDNRSIQVRTIDGVPLLVWLSDRGLYSFNGSSVVYISDAIEDEVNLNIQQVNFVTGADIQDTAADWAAGTSSAAIDLATNPGFLQTINPMSLFQDETDWESGTLTNISTIDNGNVMTVVSRKVWDLSEGSTSGAAIIVGSNLTLPVVPDWTGEGATVSETGGGGEAVAYPIIIPEDGTITSIAFFTFAVGGSYTVKIWGDTLGSPGTVLYTSSIFPGNFPSGGNISVNPSLTVSAGKYWIGTEMVSSGAISLPFINSFTGGSMKNRNSAVGPWANAVPVLPHAPITSSYAFSQTATGSSGGWTSNTYDSLSEFGVSLDTINIGSFPTSTTGTLFVDASDDPTFSTGVTTVSFSNPTGTNSLSTSNLRYWRIRYSLVTTNHVRVPSVNGPELDFATTGTWISPAILTTTDATAFVSLLSTLNIPSGTNVVATVATSPDNVTYTSFTPIGSAAIDKWAKVKFVLTIDPLTYSSPSVVNVTLNWTVTATFVSEVINVGQTPAGWGLFQDEQAASGSYAFSMHSATSSGGLSGATYHSVSNGTYPNVLILPLQYTQWKVVLTATPNSIPVISSVTINWNIGNNQFPIRVASLFFNKTYYLAAAEIAQPTNNVVIVYDFEGNWRLFRNITINSLSLFFNQPFYCDAVRKFAYQWLIPPTGTGAAIIMDARTKAFDLLNNKNLKTARGFWVTGINTGTTIHAYFSVDRGTTWIEMLNVSGSTGYTTTTDGNKFTQYFVPDYSNDTTIFSGTTVMYRITSTDAFPCKIMTMEPELYIHSGKYVGVQL